ncbi:unnamed protein product [Closterium sp. NIES-64]|nr:unnamed protein product [Closterium sp. NIES-64]
MHTDIARKKLRRRLKRVHRGPVKGSHNKIFHVVGEDTRSMSARVEEPLGQGPGHGEAHWSQQCELESASHSPAPGAPLLPPRSQPDRLHHRARGRSRHGPRHFADPDGHQTLPSADAGGTARGAQNPSDAQATPSPASAEIAAKSAARGIALAVSAGLPDLGGIGGEESEDSLETADRQPHGGELRDALGSDGKDIAAAVADAVVNARAPDEADLQGGWTQPEKGPTNTPARGAEGGPEEEDTARARNGERAHLRRGVRRDADETWQVPAPAARSPLYPLAQDHDPGLGPLRPIPPPPTPAHRQRGGGVAAAPIARHLGVARERETRGFRVGQGSSHRGQDTTAAPQRRGASSFAKAA